jgi:hypothetical protein
LLLPLLLLLPPWLQVAIRVSRLLGCYARRPDLNARMPGFRVQMGFGLHVGWAIEGAIGAAAAAKRQCYRLKSSR